MKSRILISLLACSTSTFAASKVLLETPVTYQANASVVPHIKQECQIEDMLTRRIGKVLDGVNKNSDSTLAVGTPAGDASVLRLQITHVMGVGGGAWSGPKSISVTADLIENGKVVRNTKINRWTTGGAFGGFKGTCSILDRSATAIAKDLGRWVKDPSFSIPEEAAPKEAESKEAASPAGSAPTM